MTKKKQKTEKENKHIKDKSEESSSTIEKNKILDELIGGAILLSAL